MKNMRMMKNVNSLLLNYLGDIIKDKDIKQIYAKNTIKNVWSRNVLAIQIETEFHKRINSKLYSRLQVLTLNNKCMKFRVSILVLICSFLDYCKLINLKKFLILKYTKIKQIGEN